jgi:hypothetical protein
MHLFSVKWLYKRRAAVASGTYTMHLNVTTSACCCAWLGLSCRLCTSVQGATDQVDPSANSAGYPVHAYGQHEHGKQAAEECCAEAAAVTAAA